MTKLANFKVALAGLAAMALAAWAGPAAAFNDGAPSHGNCFTCGTAQGAAPPPGLYFTDVVQYAGLNKFGNSNQKGIATVDFATNVAIFAYVPDLKLLGATPVIVVLPPPFIFLSATTSELGSGSFLGGAVTSNTDLLSRQFGTLNPVAIFDLSWPVAKDIYAGAFVAFAPYWGSRGVANDFVTGSVGGAVSYLGGGWDLTYWTQIDINGEGTISHVTPGDYWYNEFTATKDLGYVTVGLVGSANTQFTNDTGAGANQTHEISIGPFIGKAFGAADINVFWTHDVDCANTACGDTFWIRLAAKLF